MDIDRNELISNEQHEVLKKLFPEDAKRFEQVPQKLWGAARRKLHGRDRAFVSRTSGGQLSSWAAKQRQERKRRNQIAKLSRRKNR